MKNMMRYPSALAAVVILMSSPALVRASTSTYTWDGSASNGDWFDPLNWNLDALPGSTQSGGNYDVAVIPDTVTSGIINYSPDSGDPTTFDRFSVTSSVSSGGLTLNINGDLTTTHIENTASDTWGTGNRRLTVNFNAGTYTSQSTGITFSGTGTYTIGANATVIAQGGTSSYVNATTFVVGANTVVRGTLAIRSATLESSPYANTSIKLSNTLDVDGGRVLVDGINTTTNTGDGNGALIIRNGGNTTIRYGSNIGLTLGGNRDGTYANSVTMNTGGTMTNNSSMQIGATNGNRPAYGGTTTVTLSDTNTKWSQGGAAYVGSGRVGLMTVSNNATFEAKSGLTIGGGPNSIYTAPNAGIDNYGVLTIDGGTVGVTNALAGQLITANVASSFGGVGNYIYFGTGDGSWDQTYLGQRVVFSSLKSGGAGLSTGVVYYAADVASGNSSVDAKSNFGLAANALGTVFSGSGYTNYGSGTGQNVYYTLGSQLVVGSQTTFSGGATRNVAGTLNMNGGLLTTDELIANMGSGVSTINFKGGEMVIGNTYKNATVVGGLAATGATINTGSAFQVGDNIGAAGTAIYRMNGGTHTIAHGMIINSDGKLAGFGTNTATISGAGAIDPGSAANRTGLISGVAVDGSAGLDFNFEFTLANAAPGFSNWENTGNDVLRLNSVTPFVASLTATNAVNAYFTAASLLDGSSYMGGFYTDAGNFLSSIEGASFAYFITGDGNGSHLYNGVSYYTLAEYNALVGGTFGFTVDMVQSSADFGSGNVDGYMTSFTVVPEPQTALLVGMGLMVCLNLRRRRLMA